MQGYPGVSKASKDQEIIADAQTEAKNFYDTSASYLIPGNIQPVLDIENRDINTYFSGDDGARKLGLWINTWIQYLKNKNTNLEPIGYTSDSTVPQITKYSNLKYIWSARYYDILPDYTSWNIWQYTDKGVVNGISGNVDLDRFKGNKEQMISTLAIPNTINNPPNTPSTPSGSSSGNTGVSYSYSTLATDSDGNPVKYTFDWGDNSATTDTSYVNSGTSASASHSWSSANTYNVKVKATDSNGASSVGWSGSKTVTITTASTNHPPDIPLTPSGSNSGNTGVSYSYSTLATDSDGNTVKYTFDWGDGYTSDTSFVTSGTTGSASHSWSSPNTYSVKVKATDSIGASSGWSSVKTVTISTTTPTSETWGVIGTIPLSGNALPRHIAINGGKAYVSRSGGQLSVINLATNETITTVQFSPYPGSSPGYVAVSGNKAYVTLSNLGSNGQLAVVNTDDNSVSSYIAVGPDPWGVATLNNRIYVTNNVWWSNGDPATVKVINRDTNSVIASIPVGISPSSIAIDPTTRKAYVTNSNSLSNSVSVIDTDSNSVVATIATNSPPMAVAISGNRAYVTTMVNWPYGSVEVIDTATDRIISSIPVGRDSAGIAASGSNVFATNQASNTVSIIGIATNSIVTTLNVGGSPTGIAIDSSTNKVYAVNQGDKTITIIGQISTSIPAPVASFTGSPTSGTAPLTVAFTDSSTNTPTSWSWDFGDGSTSTTKNPSHTYSSAGTYTVKLTATNSAGSNTLQRAGYIAVSSGVMTPVASFTGSPTSGTAPLTVAFTDRSTNTPTSWSWDFGDGSTSTTKNPSHTYSSAGTYTVKLTATNSAGSNTLQRAGYITAPSAVIAPVASFTGSPTSGAAPLTVTFTDRSTNTPTSWSWSFGDGSSSTEKNPSHAYSSAGTYTVILTATNSAGSNAFTRASYITVTSPSATPTLSFQPGTSTVPAGSTTTYTIMQDTATKGLSGYNITIALSNPSIGKITGVTYPSWASMRLNSTIPAGSAWFQAVDLNGASGTTNIALCTVTVRGDTVGATTLAITSNKIEDRSGGQYSPTLTSAQFAVIVSPVNPFPKPGGGYFPSPTDPNHDGKYEDLDGNGWIGFNDVLLLYKYMDAIGTGAYGPVSYFDFDGSGFIGFNDVVWLYNMT